MTLGAPCSTILLPTLPLQILCAHTKRALCNPLLRTERESCLPGTADGALSSGCVWPLLPALSETQHRHSPLFWGSPLSWPSHDHQPSSRPTLYHTHTSLTHDSPQQHHSVRNSFNTTHTHTHHESRCHQATTTLNLPLTQTISVLMSFWKSACLRV